jgi:prefoldin beta subunit
MAEIKLPSEARELLLQMQQDQNFLQNLLIQKETITLQNREVSSAISSLGEAKSDVFKVIGPVMIKTDKDSLRKELEELKEQGEVQIKNLAKHEDKLKEKIKNAQGKLQKMLQGANGGDKTNEDSGDSYIE